MTSERGTRLSDKVAIVTGAGATGSGEFVGIGQAISILFARQGARVLLVDREERNAEVTLSMIREEGGEASIFAGDVTSDDDMREMAETAKSRYGNINVLINNVGISGPGSVTDLDVDFWDTVMDVNLKSVMLCSRYSIPQMIEAGGGSIINLSSIVWPARRGWAAQPPLCGVQGRYHRPEQLHGRPLRAGQRARELHRPPATSTAPWWRGIRRRRCWSFAAVPGRWA